MSDLKPTAIIPAINLDLFSDAVLQDPYPHYRRLRDLGAVVRLEPLGMYALSRFAGVREALSNWEVFSNAQGVAMNEDANSKIKGNTLGSDPPLHTQLRHVLARPLMPSAMQEVTRLIEREAQAIVDRCCDRGTFDVASELATHLPVSIISHLVGLPEAGRERMLDWGVAAFNTMGPENERCQAAKSIGFGLIEYMLKLDPTQLAPGSWGARCMEAAGRGEITPQQAIGLLIDYTAPSLDTTILAITSAVWLFALHPDQWDVVRGQVGLLPAAINETLRLESPIQVFSRYVTRDVEIDGVTLPAHSRALVMYGSANRDERKWEDPERFDIRRKAAEQLAFGYGTHQCVGLPLARLEMRAIFTALAARVSRFEIIGTRRLLNNTLRGLESLAVRVR
jgi:cytochrome P450